MPFLSYTILSALLVGIYRWAALRYRWLDTPNHRSSHIAITPRGAGVIFALLTIGAVVALLHFQSAFLPPMFAGLAVVLVGWWDDIRGVSARVRFAIYAISSAAAVISIFTHQIVLLQSGFAIAVPLLYAAIAILGLLWLINLYNFMDGINGIAATEALFVLFAIGVLAHGTPYARTFTCVHVMSGAAITGFLLWNFPLGKVFMGDAGSAFLGFFLGVLALASVLLDGPAVTVWLILLGVFIVDSGYTLLVRITTGQPWYAAHRLHAYQRLTIRLQNNHTKAVGILMAINLFWLLPLAWLVHSEKMNAQYGLGFAYLPLIAACYRLKAGISAQGQV